MSLKIVIRHSHHIPGLEFQLSGIDGLSVENRSTYLYADIQRDTLHIISSFCIESRTEFVLVEVQLVGSKRNASADFTLESTNLTLCNRELAGLSITLQET